MKVYVPAHVLELLASSTCKLYKMMISISIYIYEHEELVQVKCNICETSFQICVTCECIPFSLNTDHTSVHQCRQTLTRTALIVSSFTCKPILSIIFSGIVSLEGSLTFTPLILRWVITYKCWFKSDFAWRSDNQDVVQLMRPVAGFTMLHCAVSFQAPVCCCPTQRSRFRYLPLTLSQHDRSTIISSCECELILSHS